ncbi:efflux pump antibiotic resistance protein [Apiospora arundinis]
MAEKTKDTTGMVAEKPTGSSEPSLDNNDAGGGGGWVMDTSDFPGPKALIFIMIALFLAMFTNNLDATIIATAIPAITDEFHTIQDVACVMVKSAAQYVPGIDTEQLISVGATQLRSVYPRSR